MVNDCVLVHCIMELFWSTHVWLQELSHLLGQNSYSLFYG
jgi:hypothetical protein